MKHQNTKFVKKLEKLKPLLKIHRLPVGEYTRKKLARYLEEDKLTLTDSEVEQVDTALEAHQKDIQEFREELRS